MEIKELRQKSETELQILLKSSREQFRDLRFKVFSKQHKDVRDLRAVKKDIARILTAEKEKKVIKHLQKKPIKANK